MATFKMDVWGDLACFTRPESKVERFSYPIMTPSAARGVLDAIYAKNLEFYWQIERIDILRPIQFIALRRNEVKEKISRRAVVSAMKGGGPFPSIQVDATKDSAGTDKVGRTQRQTIALKDVKYRIHAHIVPRPGFFLADLEKQFERRLRFGKCFQQPYLGQREFAAYFEPARNEPPIALTQDLGLMVYDIFDLNAISTDDGKPYISLFQASIVDGSMEIPSWQDTRVKKPERS